MGLRDLLGLGRARTATDPVAELARPNPSASAVVRDGDLGTYGGPTSPFVVALEAEVRTLMATSGLRPRVINDMRRHHQVSSALLVQSLPITGASWAIECDDDDVREQLTDALAPVMPALMRSAARAVWAGYSPNVLVWDLTPDGVLAPVKIRDLDPFTCRVVVDASGSYQGFVQNLNTPEEVTVGPLESMWITEGLESGNLYGRSLLEAAFTPWRDQQVVNLYHLRYLERFGEPVVIARVPEGSTVTNQAEIADAHAWNAAHPDNPRPVPDPVVVDNRAHGLRIASSLRNHSQVALPGSIVPNADGKALGYAWDLSLLESGRSTSPEFADKIRELDKAIARAIFIPDLLLGDGGGIGSYALGQAHRDMWGQSVEDRLRDYGAQLSTHLVQRVARINYGENAPDARLVFAPVRDVTEGLWSLVEGLVRDGELPVDALAVAAELGIPVLDAGEAADAAEEAPGVEGAPVGSEAEEQLRRDVVHLAKPADVSGLPEWKVPQSVDPAPWRREPNARERRVNFRALEDGMNAAERATIERLEALLEGSRARVLRQVSGILGSGGTVAELMGKFASIEVGASGPYAEAWTELQRTLWTLGLQAVGAELDAAVPDKPGRDGDAIIRTLARNAAARFTAALAASVVDEVVAAYRSGVSQAGIAAAVSDLYDREIRGESRGPRLTTRTLAARAVNEGRADAIERGGIPLRGAQYSAMMDRRTCELCERLDEQLIGIGDLDMVKFTPPVHHNCRCVWVYVTMDEADFTPNWTGAPASMVERYGGMVIR